MLRRPGASRIGSPFVRSVSTDSFNAGDISQALEAFAAALNSTTIPAQQLSEIQAEIGTIRAGIDGRQRSIGRKPPHVALRGRPHTCRSTIIFLISAIALAGLRCLGQALAQFMMVWQR
jgi:hypothetical protein